MSRQKGLGAEGAPAQQEDALASTGSWDTVGLSPAVPQGGWFCLIIPGSVLPFIKGLPDCFLQLHTSFFFFF